GLGLGMLTRVLVEEELAWGDPGVAAALSGPGMAGYAVLECAAQRTAETLLAPFARDRGRRGALLVGDDAPGLEPVGAPIVAAGGGGGGPGRPPPGPGIPPRACRCGSRRDRRTRTG